jgi:hypothetical protein
MDVRESGKRYRCNRKMVKDSKEGLRRDSTCTRSELKSLEKTRAGSAQSDCREGCDCVRSYEELKEVMS